MERKSKTRITNKMTAASGITLIALVVTIIVPYDKMMKCCNIKSFLSFGYRLRWVKSLSFFNF